MQPSTSLITTIVVCLVLGYLQSSAQRGAPTAEDATGNIVFRYTPAFRGFALFIAFGIPILLTALSVVQPPQNSEEATNYFLVYMLGAALAFPLLWDSARLRVIATPEGLDCISPWRKRFFLRWDTLREVSFNGSLFCFVLRSAEGKVFRLSPFVSGIQTFLGLCEQHLPPASMRKAIAGYKFVGRVFPGDNR